MIKKFLYNKITLITLVLIIVSICFLVNANSDMSSAENRSTNETYVATYLKFKGIIKKEQEEIDRLKGDPSVSMKPERLEKRLKNLQWNISNYNEHVKGVVEDFNQYNFGMRNIEEFALRIQEQEEKGNTVEEVCKQDTEGLFTVFGIPLNADYRDVIVALEKNDMDINVGISDCVLKSIELQHLERDLVKNYREWNKASEVKDIFTIFDEESFSVFEFKYHGKSHFLMSSSFYYIHEYPLFVKNYNIYNSQFYLACTHLLQKMTLAHVKGVEVALATLENNKPPRSFLICLQLDGADEAMSNLVKKYGEPKLYFATCPGNFDKEGRKLRGYVEAYLKKRFPEYEEIVGKIDPAAPTEDPRTLRVERLYSNVSRSILPIRTQYRRLMDLPFKLKIAGSQYSSCVVEWKKNDIIILLSFDLAYDSFVGTTKPTNFRLIPRAVNYIYYPILEDVNLLYRNYEKQTEKFQQGIQKKAESGF